MYANAKIGLEEGFWQQPWYKIAGAFLILGGLAYLALSAILGALYGIGVGIDLATYWVFGLNWWEAFIEAVLVSVFALVLALAVFSIPELINWASGREIVSDKVQRWSTRGVLVWVIGTHLLMSAFLAPMKREFAAIDASNPNPSYVFTDGTRYTTEYDFGGKLTALVARRDQVIRRYGYVRVLRGWDVSPQRGGKAGIYLCFPLVPMLWDWWFGYDQAIE